MNCINKVLLIISISLSLFENRLFAATSLKMSLPRKFTCNGFNFYNSLPKVEIADKKLQESGSFEQFLTEARELAQRYNLENSMGLRLGHHHFYLGEDEIMIEKRENFEGQDALVTRPYSKIHENDATPASWFFDGERYRVFEYSYDPKVSKIFKKVRYLSKFLEEFAHLLKKYDYKNIALAIIDREWYQNYAGKYSFVERSYDRPTFASVVVNEDKLEGKTSINTSWTFKKVPFASACKTKCVLTFDEHAFCHFEG